MNLKSFPLIGALTGPATGIAEDAGAKAMKMLRVLAVGLAAVLLLWSSALAMGPAYKTDSELTQYPVIVIAAWDKAEMRPHTLVRGDVCEPGIWFLDRKRSWDDADKTLYYHVPHYRAIQPAFLEKYFAALGSSDPENAVPKLLSSDNHEVLTRVLRYLCGDVLPWPFGDGFASMYLNPPKRGNVLRSEAGAVKGLVGRDVGEVRFTAASVYAFLAGKDGVGFLRSLLKDADPNVRAVAMGTLALQRDGASIGAIAAAAQGVEDGWLGCQVIDAMAHWGDAGLIPALIPFLEIDSFAYQYGDELGIPAVQARKALYKLTGHWFPYDAAAAQQVWKEAAAVADLGKRKALLDRLLPEKECPLIAQLVGNPRYEPAKPPDGPATRMSTAATLPCTESTTKPKDVMATVRLRNASNRTVTIGALPSSVTQEWPSGSASRSTCPRPGAPAKEDFVDLRPGETTEVAVTLDDSFMLADPNDRKLALIYERNGRALGLKAWIGTVHAEFGPEWKQERKLEKVEQRWPNGNLKVVGQTMNGRPYGRWEYFNERGDRIKDVRYTGDDVGSSEYNPKYTSNKAVGARQPDVGLSRRTPYAAVAILLGASLFFWGRGMARDHAARQAGRGTEVPPGGRAGEVDQYGVSRFLTFQDFRFPDYPRSCVARFSPRISGESQ